MLKTWIFSSKFYAINVEMTRIQNSTLTSGYKFSVRTKQNEKYWKKFSSEVLLLLLNKYKYYIYKLMGYLLIIYIYQLQNQIWWKEPYWWVLIGRNTVSMDIYTRLVR